MTLDNQRGTVGAINLAAFVVMVVGAVLAAVTGLGRLPEDRLVAGGVIMIGLAVLVFFAAFVAWKEDTQLAGFLSIAAAVGFLLMRAETEGILVLLGGVLALVSTRLTPKGA